MLWKPFKISILSNKVTDYQAVTAMFSSSLTFFDKILILQGFPSILSILLPFPSFCVCLSSNRLVKQQQHYIFHIDNKTERMINNIAELECNNLKKKDCL